MGGKVEFGAEGFISRQGDGDLAVSGGHDQAFGDPAKLGGVADELSIQKNGGAIRINRHLDFGGDGGHHVPRVFHHGDGDDLLFAGSQHDVAGEVLVAVLAHRKVVRARKQKNLLRPLEFMQIAEILAVDPNAGGLFDFGCALELELAENFILGEGSGHEEDAANDESASSFSHRHFDAQCSPKGGRISCLPFSKSELNF